jgi:hypothetical protein
MLGIVIDFHKLGFIEKIMKVNVIQYLLLHIVLYEHLQDIATIK